EVVATPSGTDLTALLTAAAGGEVQAAIALSVSNPGAVPVRTFEHTGVLAVDGQATAVRDVEVVLVTVDGEAPSFGPGQVAGLGSLAPTDEVVVEHDAAPAVLAAQGAEESVA